MTTEPKTIEQNEYETIDSVISRALHARTKSDVLLKCMYDHVNVAVSISSSSYGDVSVEQVKQVLKEAANRAKLGKELKEQAAQDISGVPSQDEHVPWKSLHPMLREVVLSSLRTARARFAQQVAEGQAQQVAALSAMNGLLETQGPKGELMAASMTEGMARSLQGANDGKAAVCAAYDVAIAELEKTQ